MTDHVDLPDSELHEPKGMQGLVAGSSDVGKVCVSKGDGTSEVRKLLASEIEGNLQPTRVVYVNSKSDLPTPSGGIITLADNTTYLLGDRIFLGTDRVVMGDFTSIIGPDVDNGALDYQGTGTMLTFNDVTNQLMNFTMDCPNGRVFDWTDTAGNFIHTRNIQISEANELGVFNSTGDAVMLFETFITTNISDGMVFQGNWNILQMQVASDVQIDGTFIDLGSATFNSIGIAAVSSFLVQPTSVFLSGLANSGNINAGGLGRVTNCVITNSGGGTILDNITEDDARWRFLNNTGIRDTRPDALGYFNGNATATTIASAATPVKVNAVWTEDHVSQFTSTADGRFTFVGESDQRLPITLTANLQMDSGSSTDCKIYIAINGSVVTATGIPLNDVTTTKPISGTTIWQAELTNGDYIEFFVENTGGTADIVVTDAIMRIN